MKEGKEISGLPPIPVDCPDSLLPKYQLWNSSPWHPYFRVLKLIGMMSQSWSQC